MQNPHDVHRETEARYRALQSGALVASVCLLVVAVVSNVAYPSSLWFLAASAVGGGFVFLGWHLQVQQPRKPSFFFPVVGVALSVVGLLVELERPLLVNMVCGYSLFGAVMFAFIEGARRRQA